MYGILAAGMADWPIIHQIAWLLGKLMEGIYNVMDGLFNVQNIGICIIIFTVIIYTLMIPITIKQQKWSKMSAVMQPEIMKVQKKYANRKDQASMLKQQEEMQNIYEKYGTSPTGGCLPMLLQMPVLFALFPVIQNIPSYVGGVRDIYVPVAEKIMTAPGFTDFFGKIAAAKPVMMDPSRFDFTNIDNVMNALFRFQDSTWASLSSNLPESMQALVNSTTAQLGHINTFLGINIAESPFNMLMAAITTFSIVGIILAIIIPVLAGATQFLSMKLMPQPAGGDNPMAQQMQTMNYMMPLFSVFMGFTLPAGLGLYWAISAVVRSAQQFFINKKLDKVSTDDLIKENQKKAAKKRAKKGGATASEINKMATTSTKNVQKKPKMSDAEREKLIEKSKEKAMNAKPGSLASKANMVARFNTGMSTETKAPETDDSKNKKKSK